MCWGGGATMPRITLTGSPETRLPPAEIARRRGRGCDFSTMKAFFTRFTPVLFIGLLLLAPVGQTLADEEQAGTVTRLKGAAFAMQDAIPRVLSVGAAIQRGDVISTSPGARLEMKMLDDAVMTLGEKTIFVVIDYIAGGTGPNATMRLLQGAFSATTGKIMQTANAKFTMETPTATIGIRGTTFWGGTLDDKFEVALLENTIQMMAPTYSDMIRPELPFS